MTLLGHTDRVYKTAFCPRGTLLASAGEDQGIRIWDWKNGTTLAVLRGHTRQVNSIVFSPDGSSLASASDDGTIKIWDINTI